MSYFNLCCRSGGSNLNAGTRTGNDTVPGTSPNLTYASGSLVASTGVFTVASGNPVTDGVVANADYCSIYSDGSTRTPFVGLITAITSTTITVSLTKKMGTIPSDGAGRTLIIGGAWAGPNGTSAFPFDLALDTAVVNTSGDILCLNMKSDLPTTMSVAMTCATAGPMQISGFGATYRDEAGKWTITGATTGSSYIPMTLSGLRDCLTDAIFQNNGATGSAVGLLLSGGRNLLQRVAVASMRGHGFSGNVPWQAVECEAAGNNVSNTTDNGGFAFGNNVELTRCTSHNQSGNVSHGFVSTGSNVSIVLNKCVAHANGKAGLLVNGSASTAINECDFYANAIGLLNETGGSLIRADNSNFVANTTYGVRLTVAGITVLHNCGFPAAGTTANGTDISSTNGVIDNRDPITILANTTPYNAPSTGDFRITATSNKGTGRGAFTQLFNSMTGLVASPDVGAGQGSSASGGGVIVIEDD